MLKAYFDWEGKSDRELKSIFIKALLSPILVIATISHNW